MTVATGVRVRVWVPEVWDAVPLRLALEATVADLKEQALRHALGNTRAHAPYVVKYRGAQVLDEQRRLADLGVRDGAPFIVLPARRMAVR
jgi:WXG100 protein secretion system (Wss), protein YukD